MRLIFLLVLFVGAVFYCWIAFFDLPFLTRSGRLGPGFFPRIVGAGLVILLIWSLAEEFVARRKTATGETDPGEEVGLDRAVLVMILLCAGFLAVMAIFGGVLGSMIFLAASLAVFNPGDHMRNAFVAVAVPLVIYALFSVALNADIPDGILPLPF